MFIEKSYTIRLQGRAGLIYKEKDRGLFVDSEMLAGMKHDIILYSDGLKYWQHKKKDVHETMTDEDKTRVRANIEKELTKNNIKWVWQ